MDLWSQLLDLTRQYLAGALTFEELRRWRREHIRELVRSDDPRVLNLHGTLALALAEHSIGDRSEADLQAVLREVVPADSDPVHVLYASVGDAGPLTYPYLTWMDRRVIEASLYTGTVTTITNLGKAEDRIQVSYHMITGTLAPVTVLINGAMGVEGTGVSHGGATYPSHLLSGHLEWSGAQTVTMHTTLEREDVGGVFRAQWARHDSDSTAFVSV